MKYGEALPQRSVQEWLPYNLDYTEIKQLIKRYTIAKPPVELPHQKTEFEDEIYRVLMDQLESINLFVKSKAGEIDRRLGNCRRQVASLQARTGARTSPKILKSRYTKLEEEVERAGYDIRSLSRFVAAQRTGFYKLLKKYRKWTGSESLSNRFLVKLESSSSFYRPDFDGALAEYSEILGAVRVGLGAAPRKQQAGGGAEAKDLTQGERLAAARPSNSATFWVHYDHLVELQVLLLQNFDVAPSSSSTAENETTLTGAENQAQNGHKSERVTTVLFDDLKRLSKVHGSTTLEDGSRSCLRSAARVRWTAGEPQAETLVSDLVPDHVVLSLDKKDAKKLFDFDTAEYPEAGTLQPTAKNARLVREWFRAQPKIIPLAKITAGRSVLGGKTSEGQICVTLEKDIRLFKASRDELFEDPPASAGDNNSADFPHAVCEISWTGGQTPDFVRQLKQSHLVEYVPGFSLDIHAISTLYQPKNMTSPHWLRALETDIRKTPTDADASSTRHHSRTNTTRAGSPAGSSNESTAAGLTDTTLYNETSHSSAPPSDAGSHSRRIKFKKQNQPRRKRSNIEAIRGTQRYWNELAGDDDSDQDEPYTILIHRRTNGSDTEDDDEKTIMEYLSHNTKKLFRKMRHPLRKKAPRSMERTPLLNENDHSSPDEAESSSDEDAIPKHVRHRNELHYHSLREEGITINDRPPNYKHLWFMLFSLGLMVLTGALALNESMKRRKNPQKHAGRRLAADAGAMSGTIVALMSGVVGISMFLTGNFKVGWVHAVAVWVMFAAVCVGAGSVLALVARTETGG